MQNPEKFKSRMQSLAYGGAMAAAARDYQKVVICSERATLASTSDRIIQFTL